VELLGVGKRYRTSGWIVRDVGLQIEPGELVVFEGANGSGKSSLLRMIAGVSRLTAGEISGRPTTIAYAPDQLPADERVSARTFLTHFGGLRGLRRSEASRTAEALIERFELVGDPNEALRTLSKGNLQKVCLAQAFLVPCDLLVLDEPASSLDEAAVATLHQLIEERRNAGAVCVMSDHPDQGGRPDRATIYKVADSKVVRQTIGAVRVATFRPTGAGTEIAWHSLPGVGVVTSKDADAVEVCVSAECSNQLIETAIRSGWTLTEMRTR
jgi:ABC-type uncharacterized transport system ATPase subunit